jgi:hypothetical protein
MSTLFSDAVTVSISSSRILDCSSGYKTSQIGSSRLNALVISAKSTGLADVVIELLGHCWPNIYRAERAVASV